MNNDLISRKRLMHEAEKYFRDSKALADDVLNLVSVMPAVDAVEVCRCEYCNKGHPELGTDGCVWCVRYGRDMNLDDFCSYGERKEN